MQQVFVAVLHQLAAGGVCPQLFQTSAGGQDGGLLDVHGQHTSAAFLHQLPEKGGVPAVAAGGIDAQPGGGAVTSYELLRQLHGGQVRLAAAHQLPALGSKAEFCPEGGFGRRSGRRCGEHRGPAGVKAAPQAQDLFDQVGAVTPAPPGGVQP